MKNMWLTLIFMSGLSGCVYYRPAAVSSTSIGSKNEVPVRVANGESSAYYIFGLGPIGDDSLNAAIEDAKGYAPSDSIANVFVDRRTVCFPLCVLPIVMRIDTLIYGTLVRYTKDDGTPMLEMGGTPVAGFNPDNKELLGAPLGADVKDTPLRFSFENAKKGEKFNILFKTDKKGKKVKKDGLYEFLWREYGLWAPGSCGMIKPMGGGFFSRKVVCLEDIASIEPAN